MILRKVNFNMIFAYTRSSDYFSFAFMNVVILVLNKMEDGIEILMDNVSENSKHFFLIQEICVL